MENKLSSRYLSKAAVLNMLEISERNLENSIREQRFPPGVKIGKKLFWTHEVVQLWLDEKFANQLQFKPSSRRTMSRSNRR